MHRGSGELKLGRTTTSAPNSICQRVAVVGSVTFFS
jgi:hypothetical protein